METLDINPYQTGSIEYGCELVQYICVNLGDYMVDDNLIREGVTWTRGRMRDHSTFSNIYALSRQA